MIEYSNSSLEKDSTVKYRIYAEAGISEYWLVNLQRRELIIYRDPRDGEYGSKITLTEGAVTPLAFPDLQIPVEAMICADWSAFWLGFKILKMSKDLLIICQSDVI